MWDTSCVDWRERLLAGRSLVPTMPLNEAEAAKAVRIFNRLRLPDVIGRPTLGESTGDWFRDIVRALFGSYDPDSNTRAIQEVFLLVPKKNGKSTNAAGVMVTACIMNRRPDAELLLIAPTKEVADIAFRQASGMIRADRQLADLFHLQRHIRTINHRLSGATIKIIAADTDTVTGAKATYILVDETHELAAKPKAADILVELRGSLAARPDGFLFQITTQSKRPPSGVFLSELTTARRVRDGAQSLPLLPVLYELPSDMAADGGWRRPESFGLVNPSLGQAVNEAFLLRELEKAEMEGEAKLQLFASQHLNVEIGAAVSYGGWAGAEFWMQRAETGLSLQALLRRCDVITIGADGGGRDDLLALCLLGREIGTGRWLAWCKAWAWPSALHHRKSEAARYEDFRRAGDLVVVDAVGEDLAELVEIVGAVRDAGLLPEKHCIGVDPGNHHAVTQPLLEAGFDDGQIVWVSQGWRLGGAMTLAERMLAEGSLVHAGQPLMAWCVGNAKVEPKGNARIITKQASGSAKVDAVMAMLNAVELMSRNPTAGCVAEAMIV